MAINKSRVAYYAFGDSKRQSEVDNVVLGDAEILLRNELNKQKADLGNTADLDNVILQLAGAFFAVHLMVKAGLAIDRSGVVTSESIDGMSVGYESVGQRQVRDNNPPKDFIGMAKDMVNRYVEETQPVNRGIGVVITNYRSKILKGFYDKYGERYTHGVP